jgi:hypothetical protein
MRNSISKERENKNGLGKTPTKQELFTPTLHTHAAPHGLVLTIPTMC